MSVQAVTAFLVAFAAIVLLAAMPSPAAALRAPAVNQQLYVSLGDSYAVGYEPGIGSTLNSFPDQVPGIVKKRGYNLKVVNFGCSGASSKSLIEQVGCHPFRLGFGAKPYPEQTQLAAATQFIKDNRSKIALITVSIGGNDIVFCSRATAPLNCVAAGVANINKNVTAAVKVLRNAAGPKPKIVGTTYPYVVFGFGAASVSPASNDAKNLANFSVIAFRSLINPALKKAYRSVNGSFVDVTAATGAYGSMKVFEKLAPYGSIPKPIAAACKISYFCNINDVHLSRSGNQIVAKLVAAQLPKRKYP